MELTNEYIGLELSHGTMVPEDLISTFMEFLVSVASVCNIGGRVKAIQDEITAADGDQEWLSYLLNEDLFDLLNEIVPKYCCFGSHEGDGAAYGFWTDEEALNEEVIDRLDTIGSDTEFKEIRETISNILYLMDMHQR